MVQFNTKNTFVDYKKKSYIYIYLNTSKYHNYTIKATATFFVLCFCKKKLNV